MGVKIPCGKCGDPVIVEDLGLGILQKYYCDKCKEEYYEWLRGASHEVYLAERAGPSAIRLSEMDQNRRGREYEEKLDTASEVERLRRIIQKGNRAEGIQLDE